MTLTEISHCFDGAAKRLEREHNETAWLAWHVAFMSAYAPQKSETFFKLKNLLWGRKPTEQKPQDWRDSLAAFSAWVSSSRK